MPALAARCVVLAVSLLSLTVQLCDAYPSRYVQSFATTCDDHPQRGYNKHGYNAAEDRDMQLVLKEGSQAVSKVCPGVTYILQASFPVASYAIATTTLGVFSNSVDTCPNRIVWDPDLQYGSGLTSPATSYSTQLSIPCAAKQTTGFVKVTSATSATDSYHHRTWSYSVDPTCKAQACSAPAQPQQPLRPQQSLFTAPSNCTRPYKGGSKCERSLWGYTCAAQLEDGGPRVHWTVGGCFPDNFCTTGQTLRMPKAQPQNISTYLHMLLEAPTTGFAALGFAARRGKMHDADALIGWISSTGLGSINTYHISGYNVPLSAGSQLDNQWIAGGNVLSLNYGPQKNHTILCFSRPLTSTNSRVAPSLTGNDVLTMNWAMGGAGQDGLVKHTHAGSFVLNLRTGEVKNVDLRKWARVHANLMIAAWVGVLPLGIFVAMNKWVLIESKVLDAALWFQLHRFLQVVGTITFLAGIIIAFVQFENVADTAKGKAHLGLGVVVFALTIIQVIGALPRPHPGTPRRPMWNQFHHWTGRTTLLLAVINLFIGMALFHDKFHDAPIRQWLGPAIAILVALFLADIGLRIYKLRRRKEDRTAPSTSATGHVNISILAEKPTTKKDPLMDDYHHLPPPPMASLSPRKGSVVDSPECSSPLSTGSLEMAVSSLKSRRISDRQ